MNFSAFFVSFFLLGSMPKWDGVSPVATFKSPQSIYVGVSGHPLYQSPYGHSTKPYWISLATQIARVKELDCDFYRVDAQFASNFDASKFQEIADACANQGIKLFPTIMPIWHTYLTNGTYTVDDCGINGRLYTESYNFSVAFATAFDSYVLYYQLDNELNFIARTAQAGSNDGNLPTDYDLSKSKMCYWIIRGIYDGLINVNPNAQTVANVGSWAYIGFLEFLNNPTWLDASLTVANGYTPINFSIAGWNVYPSTNTFYSGSSSLNISDKNITRQLSKFTGKWMITEWNSASPNSDSDAADKTDRWIRDMIFNSGYPPVAVCFYQLYQQSSESVNYGLISITGTGVNGDPYIEGSIRTAFYSFQNLASFIHNTHTYP